MASFLFRVNPAGSYLSVDVPVGSAKPIAPTSVKLSDLGVVPGDTIALLAQGDYKAGSQFSDNSDGLLAVFVDQSGSYLAPANYRQKFTQKQSSGQQTDISQDFKLADDIPEGIVTPSNAHAILFSVEDSFYSDNSDPDGDFGVTIKTGADALISGADALRGIDKHAQVSGTNDDDDGFPFFNLVNVKPFISQNWTSQVFFNGENNYRVTSSQGSRLEVTERFNSRNGYDSESVSLNFLNFSGDKLDFRISFEETQTSNSSVSTGSLSYTWSYLGLSNTQSDDVSVQVLLTSDNSETWQSGTTSERENGTLDFSISKGDSVSGLRYQAKGSFVDTFEKRNGATVQENNVTVLNSLSYQDFKAGLQINFSADSQEDYLTNRGTWTFKNVSGNYQNKTYSSSNLTLTEKDKIFEVNFGDIDSLTPFFRDVVLPKLSSQATSTGSAITSSGVASGSSAGTASGTTSGSTSSTTTTTTATPATATPAVTTPVAPIIPNGTEKVGSDTVDRLQGGSGPDVIRSGGGNDIIIGSDGTDYIDGGTGIDQISYSSRAGSISFAQDTGGNIQVRLGNKTDTLKDVERVSFTDKAYALDLGGSAGVAAKAIIAAFGKNAVSQYLGVALTMTDKGSSAADLVKIVMDNKMLPSDHGQFVQTVFNNVVGRAPNALEMLQFKGILDRGEMNTTQLLAVAANTSFAETVLSEIAIAGVALEYAPTLA
jgi:hypothetical protein